MTPRTMSAAKSANLSNFLMNFIYIFSFFSTLSDLNDLNIAYKNAINDDFCLCLQFNILRISPDQSFSCHSKNLKINYRLEIQNFNDQTKKFDVLYNQTIESYLTVTLRVENDQEQFPNDKCTFFRV